MPRQQKISNGVKIYDISLPLSPSTVTWPGENPIKIDEHQGTAITSRLDFPSHFGTHIDAPRHFVFSLGGVDEIPVSKLVGPCRVVVSRAQNLVSLEEVKKLRPKKNEKILFKTRNSKLLSKKSFTDDYVSLSLEAAKYLAKIGIDLIGIDYFGIEAKSAPDHPVHKALLQKNIVIVEACDLRKISPGRYHIAALPLKIKNADGSPARVVLWK